MCVIIISLRAAVRLEQMMQEKIQGYKDIRFTEMDLLGMYMIQAGNDLISGAPAYSMLFIITYIHVCSLRVIVACPIFIV